MFKTFTVKTFFVSYIDIEETLDTNIIYLFIKLKMAFYSVLKLIKYNHKQLQPVTIIQFLLYTKCLNTNKLLCLCDIHFRDLK